MTAPQRYPCPNSQKLPVRDLMPQKELCRCDQIRGLEMKDYLGLPRGGSLYASGRKVGVRKGDGMTGAEVQVMFFETERGAPKRGTQAAPVSWERRGSGLPPPAFRRKQLCRHLEFSPQNPFDLQNRQTISLCCCDV